MSKQDNLTLFDLVQFWGDDKDIILSYLREFKSNSDHVEASLSDAISRKNLKDLKFLCHRTKGFLLNLHNSELTNTCDLLTKACQNNEVEEALLIANRLISTLRMTSAKVEVFLKSRSA